jgi:hypothetical protein
MNLFFSAIGPPVFFGTVVASNFLQPFHKSFQNCYWNDLREVPAAQ